MAVVISGNSLSPSSFNLHVDYQFNSSWFEQVLTGHLAAYQVKQYIPAATCEQIWQRFWDMDHVAPRYGDGNDGVEGYILGASHIECRSEDYILSSLKFAPLLKQLFADLDDPVATIRQHIAVSQPSIRPAVWKQQPAGVVKAIAWNHIGEFLLEPHDDFAQTRDPLQQDFEIQQCQTVFAVNLYVRNPQSHGQLKIWNIQPDLASRRRLGVEHSGYPYPAAALQLYADITVPLEGGDLCIINGNLVHAVLCRHYANLTQERLLLTFFMGFNTAGELIVWT